MQHEIIQSGATESVCLPELLPERTEEGTAVLTKRSTLTVCMQRALLDVLIQMLFCL